ncbi:MAG: hypothetical protein L6264_07410 [Weeksellaceae bacterium]|nr:hypothetical protein [Kaistella haifensis]MBU4536966.1 hypothetical protein [Bacteroidota bacterium]MCG2780761.1 hypothetical protein [Weeksellaceae bacterium]
MEEIKEGDVVSLKSSESYTFTVGRIETQSDKKIAVLFYFDSAAGELKKVNVPVAALKKQ